MDPAGSFCCSPLGPSGTLPRPVLDQFWIQFRPQPDPEKVQDSPLPNIPQYILPGPAECAERLNPPPPVGDREQGVFKILTQDPARSCQDRQVQAPSAPATTAGPTPFTPSVAVFDPKIHSFLLYVLANIAYFDFWALRKITQIFIFCSTYKLICIISKSCIWHLSKTSSKNRPFYNIKIIEIPQLFSSKLSYRGTQNDVQKESFSPRKFIVFQKRRFGNNEKTTVISIKFTSWFH